MTSLSASLRVDLTSARLNLGGSMSATALLYAKNSQNNSVSFAPNVDLSGKYEAIDKFAYVDVSASVGQSYVSPFGAQPSNITVPSDNRYTTQTYRISPYIQGVTGPNLSYTLRDDNIWTVASRFGDSGPGIPNTYSNSLTGSISSPVAPWGWTLDVSRQYYDNGGATGGASTIEVVRGTLPYQIDPQLQVSLRAGYESDRFAGLDSPDVTYGNTIYGAGMNWRPTERTSLDGFWEHRFFGSSYSAQLSHRLPNVALSASFSRGLSTYPQLALLIPASVNIASYLDAAYTTRIPDPAARLIAVQQFLAQTGLPPSLFSPLNFYSPSIQLQESQTASAVFIGVRNSLSFTVFNVKSEVVTGVVSTLPPLQFSQNSTQTGTGVSFTHSLSGQTSLSATATYSRTKPVGDETTDGSFRSNNFNANLGLSTAFSPKTSGSAGISYSKFESPGSSGAGNSTFLSIFASVSHTFR